jgi:hypothetical protein
MALTSPITITIGAQAYSCKRVNQDSYGAVYQDKTTVAGTDVKLILRNADEGKAKVAPSGTGLVSQQNERHIADLVVTTYDANGFPTVVQSYTHIRNLKGADVTAVGNVAQALSAFVTTNADLLVAGISFE